MGDIQWSLCTVAHAAQPPQLPVGFSDTYIPQVYGGCAAAAPCCLGNARMLCFAEEVGGATGRPQQIYRSADNGQTWTWLFDVNEQVSFGWSSRPPRMLVLSLDTAIVVAYPGPLVQSNPPTLSTYGPAPYTADAGASWAQHRGGLTENDTCQVQGYAQLSPTEILLFGFFDQFIDGPIHWIRTTDQTMNWSYGGAMPLADPSGVAYSGDYLGSDVVVVGTAEVTTLPTTAPAICRSTNRGAAWSRIALPVAVACRVAQINIVRGIGSNVVLAGGFAGTSFATADIKARLWRSADNGVTWADISAALPNIVASSKDITDILPLGAGRAVLCMSGDNTAAFPNQHKYWWLTEDSGVTWAQCTMLSSAHAPNVFQATDSMAIADDGSILCTVEQNGTPVPGKPNVLTEIWRGVPSGFSVVGTCTSLPPPVGGLSANCPPPITAVIGFPYSGQVGVSGGTPPYTYAVTAGALPPGVTLIPSGPGAGLLSGVPIAAGTFSFTITVTDSLGNTASTSSCPLVILEAPSSFQRVYLPPFCPQVLPS